MAPSSDSIRFGWAFGVGSAEASQVSPRHEKVPAVAPRAIIEIGTVEVLRAQKELWESGDLAPKWVDQFPQLFDELDRDFARGPQPLEGKGFWEFLAAIILHHATGYRSLWSRYPYREPPVKQEVVERLSLFSIVTDRGGHGGTQVPDLLMYAEDYSDWFFCEVKGPRDYLRPKQIAKFEDLARATGKPIRLLKFKLDKHQGQRG